MIRAKAIRRAAHLSQSEVARRALLNNSTLSLIETGRFVPYPGQLAKLKSVLLFNGPAEALLDDIDEAEL